ncbi:MAG: DinB family protein [SAR202 cluster bacterium]|jgi:uncharacterized damage-inducible protein DinB|nr:DinB family protein [SAR202 cluster bacterium]MDP6798742.1 DinB family protein [SAR202 cluster bacterium]MQG68195.1 DinB family protein [SAR202 cluster bacterium]|tara:strand:- start:17373 stop:17900 length:528 start_codon:yes stop_codon:yes gene_type:complete
MTTAQGEAERVRGYLLSQGERYTFAELWVRFVKARLDLIDAAAGVSDEQAAFKPDPDEWSILEVLSHVVTVSGRVSRLVETLANGGTRSADDVEDQQDHEVETIDRLRTRLLADSIAWSAMTERLPEPPSFDATSNHFAFGELHARAWYLFQRVHDMDHIGQIGKNKQTPGYPSS